MTLTDIGLSLRHTPRKSNQLLRALLQPLVNLTSLDLSNWSSIDITLMKHLQPSLQALVLYNVPRSNIEKGINVICGLVHVVKRDFQKTSLMRLVGVDQTTSTAHSIIYRRDPNKSGGGTPSFSTTPYNLYDSSIPSFAMAVYTLYRYNWHHRGDF